MNPCRFARAYLGRDFVQALDNTGVFPAGFASPQPKSAPRKLRSTCEPVIIEGFLLPTSAAGLTPGKGGGAKRPDKGRSQAAGVRVLSPSSFLPSTRKILGPAQRPHPLGQKEIQRKGHVFFFFPFFLFLAKERMGEERKTPSRIASLCFTAPPSAEPTAACFAAPPARWRSGGGPRPPSKSRSGALHSLPARSIAGC